MYLGNGTQLKLIKSNSLINTPDYEHPAPKQKTDFSAVANQKECITNKFLFQMDQGLSIILKSYPLPVFVMGREKLLTYFKKITKNEENLVHFMQGNYEEASELDLGCVMKHFLYSWNKLKQLHLLKQIEKAKEQNKLRIGIEEILKATRGNRAKLLVVEKKIVNHSQTSETYNPSFRTDCNYNEGFFIKDEVDDIIKNVFENGGDVEFVDEELSKDYRHIVLIERN
jgi:hypothetical protein